MRIWDIDPNNLCRKHLLSEHRELHGLWNILTIHKEKGGYSHHPETLRWRGKKKALYKRHQELVKEMTRRGYKHNSSLDEKLARDSDEQDVLLNSRKSQKEILKNKNCDCFRN